jgi:hypothetical protein
MHSGLSKHGWSFNRVNSEFSTGERSDNVGEYAAETLLMESNMEIEESLGFGGRVMVGFFVQQDGNK